MKSYKSYTCEISGNVGKVEYIENQLEVLEELSWFVFTLGTRYSKDWWFNQKKLYNHARKFFPELNSKVLQSFLLLYKLKKGRKLPKKPIKPSIYLDYQISKCEHSSKTKYTNYWLKFHRKYFPLFGEKILKRIDLDKVKMIQIFKKKNKLYCKLSEVKELDFNSNNSNSIGCDINYKRVVFSDNEFYNLRQLAHRKIEHKKNNRKLGNYTKDFLHKLTTQISNDLQSKGIDVLVLEDLRNLRKSASRKLGTNKGKLRNYIVNSFPYSMFQQFLEYKCLDRGIKVEYITPSYTSKSCSKCGSRNTERPVQQKFICKDCNFQLDADLNGSRNIWSFYTGSKWATSESSPGLDL